MNDPARAAPLCYVAIIIVSLLAILVGIAVLKERHQAQKVERKP